MNKKYIIILINLSISIILLFLFIDPLWSSVKMLKTETTEQKQEIINIETLLSDVQKLEQEYQEINIDMNDVFLALPKEKDIPYLMNQFEILASNNGLLLESMKFDEEINRKNEDDSSRDVRRSSQPDNSLSPFPYLSFEIILNGSYDGIKGYLESLGDNIRLMDVRKIDFKREDEGSGLSSLSIFKFTLGVIVYYQ